MKGVDRYAAEVLIKVHKPNVWQVIVRLFKKPYSLEWIVSHRTRITTDKMWRQILGVAIYYWRPITISDLDFYKTEIKYLSIFQSDDKQSLIEYFCLSSCCRISLLLTRAANCIFGVHLRAVQTVE